jgi:hypothetical protein
MPTECVLFDKKAAIETAKISKYAIANFMAGTFN